MLISEVIGDQQLLVEMPSIGSDYPDVSYITDTSLEKRIIKI
jgi:hypothetical protein